MKCLFSNTKSMQHIKGIYKIVSPSGSIYIGQSYNINGRFAIYKCRLAPKQPKLRNSFIKYGFDAHKLEVLCLLPNDVTQDVIDSYEIFYIKQFSSCGFKMMNIKEGGSCGKMSAESKEKLRISQTGTKKSDETREKLRMAAKRRLKLAKEIYDKIREQNTGQKRSLETKNKISIALRGRKFSDEHRRNISLSHTGMRYNEEYKNKMSRIQLELYKRKRNE